MASSRDSISTRPGINAPNSSLSSGRVAVHNFSAGLPEQPKLTDDLLNAPIMPGDPVMEKNRETILTRFDTIDAELSGFENLSFLKRVTFGKHAHANESRTRNETGWTFESRRTAQPILPFLYLGPAGIAKDSEWLARTGITMVLLIRDLSQEISKMLAPRKAQQMGLETHVLDVPPNKVVSWFQQGINLINKHLSDRAKEQDDDNEIKLLNREAADESLPGKVLVYDLTGNEIAASMVTAYIMAMYSTLPGEAVYTVQGRRFSINTLKVIESVALYHGIIQAKRDTRKTTIADSAPSENRGKKRVVSFDDAVDAFESISMGTDDYGSSGRSTGNPSRSRPGQAPFLDISRSPNEHSDSPT